MPLPTDRTLLDTPEEHLDDHNALCAQHNELEGHADDTTNVHGIANTAVLATQSYVTTAVANLVDAAPDTLDTLNELAAALGDDANFATTVTTALAGKAATGHNHDATYEAAGAVGAHTGDTSDAHDASAVSFAPAGGIAATDVQAAIVELDTEKSGTGHAHTGTYVPLAEIDAKGDLLVGSAADTLNNLPVGTDGHVLTADSAETLGVKWAAAAGGTADGPSSLFASGRYSTRPHTARATMTPTLSRLYVNPIWVPRTLTVDRIVCNVSSGGTAGSVVRLGIYNDAAGVPGSLLVATGTLDTTSGGVKEATISQQLTAGVWWLAFVAQVAAPIVISLSTLVALTSESTPSSTVVFGFRAASVTGALPDPSGATTEDIGANPAVWLRAV